MTLQLQKILKNTPTGKNCKIKADITSCQQRFLKELEIEKNIIIESRPEYKKKQFLFLSCSVLKLLNSFLLMQKK